MHEVNHLINLLNQAKSAVENSDVLLLKNLSNQTIHSASIEKDTDSVMMAVIIYSLSKIIERRTEKNGLVCDDFCREISRLLQQASDSLENKSYKKFSVTLSKITDKIKNLQGDVKNLVQDVFDKAKINKASKIYEHGISMEETSKLLGITLWDLASYTGQRSDISDNQFNKTVDQKTRIKIAMEIFS